MREGAGKTGCALHPRSRVPSAQRKRTRAYRFSGGIRPSLRNGFTAYFALSPVNGSFATVAPEKLASRELDASTAASGPHDFAVRNQATLVSRSHRVHRIPPRVRDDRERPSCRVGRRINELIWGENKRGIFSPGWLDDPNHVDPSSKFRPSAKRLSAPAPGHATVIPGRAEVCSRATFASTREWRW